MRIFLMLHFFHPLEIVVFILTEIRIHWCDIAFFSVQMFMNILRMEDGTPEKGVYTSFINVIDWTHFCFLDSGVNFYLVQKWSHCKNQTKQKTILWLHLYYQRNLWEGSSWLNNLKCNHKRSCHYGPALVFSRKQLLSWTHCTSNSNMLQAIHF